MAYGPNYVVHLVCVALNVPQRQKPVVARVLPGSQVKERPVGPCLDGFGQYLTYFWGPGSSTGELVEGLA